MLTQDQLSKLPKWAQSEIAILQMRLKEANEELNRIKANEPSNTMAGFEHSHTSMEAPHYLKNGQLITFKFGNKKIQARINDKKLCIMGTESILIQPTASNTCEIQFNQ